VTIGDVAARLTEAGITILGPVEGVDGASITGPCVLGHPTRDGDDRPLRLGPGVVIRAFAVLYAATELGRGVQVGHGALVRERNVIGEGSSIGSGAQLEPGNVIGRRTRIHSSGFLSTATIGNDVFCGPRVVFTDDPHPPCPRYLDCVGGVVVDDRVSIGAGAVLLPGVTIGAGALVGAGAVVTRSVEAGDVVAGNPARRIGRRNEMACSAGFYDRAYSWLEDIPAASGVERERLAGIADTRNDSSISTH
jgi:acetyltransferase-like isoleucine patch superfamily enzyme